MAKAEYWTERNTYDSCSLELPLLLLLRRDKLVSTFAIEQKTRHGEDMLDRALRLLCSKGLAHRRQERYRPYKNQRGVFVEERVVTRWLLSERGAVWRDQLIRAGKVAQLPDRYRVCWEEFRRG